ncbi:death-associated inhibitor of apoptosis 2-like isoform X2 [Epargyreus clarus]|uniref:death-associated inhibitor of apoptosis 2-like isoform X2 n=1 Tax=Epargyreus clarus TaxID=520877 RepID=UPI003C2B3C2F
MNQESNRLNTFSNWPASAPVNSTRLAKGGFFYTGQGTEVQCFSCGGKISDWNYGDQVMWRHRRLDPNCAFVVNPLLSGNVAMTLESSSASSLTTTTPRCLTEPTQEESRQAEEDEMYKSDALRFLSFSNWTDTSVSRENLVSAGFYHLGGGRLRCAWCTGELGPFSNFGSIGTPTQVHRMYFPHCEHAAEIERNMRLREDGPRRTPKSIMRRCAKNMALTGSGAEQNARVVAAGSEWRSLGVVGGGARHPTHAGLASRLATFDGWPADRAQDPRALADAGFFYTGVDDQVRCFYCDGGLGKWEAGDAPWSEHAHWFPHCGYVLLVKGQEFVDSCKERTTVSANRSLRSRIRNVGFYDVEEDEVEEVMNSDLVTAALGAGLDVARIRRAICRRLRTVGQPFVTSEALIDAVLDEQLNEEPWCTSPHNHRFARDILAEALLEVVPTPALSPDEFYDDSPRTSPIPNRALPPEERYRTDGASRVPISFEPAAPRNSTPDPDKKTLTLEEENRQLKEARICKVCMDGEVSVVFLPCGHLVSCAGCGAALAACPLCRAPVRALVRAYLA